jgi:hypothetical protein
MSQQDQILAYMKRHPRGITPLLALTECGCFRLAARIYDLRWAGHDINVVMVDRGDTKVAQYSLNQKRPPK